MAWSVDSGITIANLMTTINTRLTATGWTDADAGYNVYTATNNQGGANCVQITNCQNSGAAADSTHNRYLQFQGWRSWSGAGHAGTDGSGTTYNRLYYAAADVADTAVVDLYMSVTANRMIIHIETSAGYRNWAYFGGLDSMAGTNDPTCIVLITAYGPVAAGNATAYGMVLNGPCVATAWTMIFPILPGAYVYGSANPEPYLLNATSLPQGLSGTPGQLCLLPILMVDGTSMVGLVICRGNLDGLLFCPTGNGAVGNDDTVIIGGVTYLIVVPGGVGSGSNGTGHPITGNYNQGIAIATV